MTFLIDHYTVINLVTTFSFHLSMWSPSTTHM